MLFRLNANQENKNGLGDQGVQPFVGKVLARRVGIFSWVGGYLQVVLFAGRCLQVGCLQVIGRGGPHLLGFG
jgi:hypothetical protein